jgi:PleD family two-component response regulator
MESRYRCDGEEFVVVAEQTSLDAAVNMASWMRCRVKSGCVRR